MKKKCNRKTWTAIIICGMLLVFCICNFSHLYQRRGILISDLKNESGTDFDGIRSDISDFLQDELYLRSTFIEGYGLMQKGFLKNEINSFDLVRDRDGYLHSGNFYSGFSDDSQSVAIQIKKLQDYAEDMGAKFGFFVAPMKVVADESRYYGVPYNDHTKNADDLLLWLRRYSVPYLDLRKSLDNSGMTQENMYYKTDHHWKTAAAFYAYCDMVSWMETQFEVNLGIVDTGNYENYEVKEYPELMFGSQGRNAGVIYSGGREDFEVYLPKKNGRYQAKYGLPADFNVEEGGFYGALFRPDLEKEITNIYEDSCYDLGFLYWLKEYSSITNLEKTEGERLLLIGDSYSSPLVCYMAQNFAQVDFLYVLGLGKEEMLRMMEEQDYDYICLCIYPENISFGNLQFFEVKENEE